MDTYEILLLSQMFNTIYLVVLDEPCHSGTVVLCNACTSQANGQAKFLVRSSTRAPCTVFSFPLSRYLRVCDLQQPGSEHLKSVTSSFLCFLSYFLSIAILQQSLDWYMSTCFNCSSMNRTLTWSQAVAWYTIGRCLSTHLRTRLPVLANG